MIFSLLAPQAIQREGIILPQAGTFELALPVNDQPPGLYVVRLKTGESVYTSKIVVSR